MQEYEATKPLYEFLAMPKTGIAKNKSKLVTLAGQW
jgi:hypothetical protein